RSELQCLIVGLDGRFVLLVARQGIAAIVMIAGGVALGKTLCRAGIVASLIASKTLPAIILEVFGGLARTVLFKQAHALLIRARPKVIQADRAGWLRQGNQ